jgi:hypothetical protein
VKITGVTASTIRGAALLAVGIVLVAAVPSAAVAGLPLGDRGLPETRSTQPLAAGVTLTRIVRGDRPATPRTIPTTTRGPWRVNVVTIDPARARGRVEAAHGPDLAGTETVPQLVRAAGALVGVNASFFAYDDHRYPGDPLGLAIADGQVLSEPAATDDREADLVVDGAGRVTIGRLRWTATLRNPGTGQELAVVGADRAVGVPAACAGWLDQGRCGLRGDAARFSSDFAATTPFGLGAEVVLDRTGCVVLAGGARGTPLQPG